jgi:hypothetical protein
MPILLNAVRDPEKKACAVSKSYRRKLVRARIGTAAAYRGVLEASTVSTEGAICRVER